jgi:hypothetical protein
LVAEGARLEFLISGRGERFLNGVEVGICPVFRNPREDGDADSMANDHGGIPLSNIAKRGFHWSPGANF